MHLSLASGRDQHTKLQVGDIILIMHSTPASNSQILGCSGLQASSMDLTLAAVSLTAHSDGMFILSLIDDVEVTVLVLSPR